MEKFTNEELDAMAAKLTDKESYEDATINVANLRALIEQAKAQG